MEGKRLLAVWAHPDDESFGPVGTLRLARDVGWQTAIICATRGAAGQLGDLALGDQQTVGDLREAELRCACKQIGVDQLYLWHHPDGGLRNVPPATLSNDVLVVMRHWQPTIVITFGPDGITGHPDHIAVSTATTAAFHRLRSELDAHEPQRLYYVTVPPEQRIEHRMGKAPAPGPSTAVLDVSAYADVKRAALRCHASQRGDWEPLLANHDWLTTDRFQRAVPPMRVGAPVETTLFDA
jgi:LmbE family N-acetylglucosaminyl deacetylase